MKILVKASCPSYTDIPYCHYAVYTIGVEELRCLKLLRTAFGNAQEMVSDLYQMSFFRSFAEFYDNLDISEFLSDSDIAKFEADDYLQLPEEFITTREASQVEMELVVIAEDGFFLSVIPKYTAYQVETTGIGYNVLDRVQVGS